VVGKVLSELATETEPDWINVKNTREPVDERKLRPFEVRLRGGCELEVIGHFMRLEAPSVKLEVVTQKGLFPIMRHSSALLHQALKPHNADVEAALAKVGLPSEDFNSSFFSPCENDTAIVFSNTADVHPLYRHKSLDITICVNQPELGMITRSSLEELDNFFNERKVGKDERERVLKIYRELRNNYELIYGSPALDQLALMFRDIISRIPKNGLMLWVAPNSVYVRDGRLIENPTIERNNSSLREAAKKSPNVKIIEMTSLVQTNEEFTSRPDHFNRMVYYRLAQRIYSDFDQWRQADKAA